MCGATSDVRFGPKAEVAVIRSVELLVRPDAMPSVKWVCVVIWPRSSAVTLVHLLKNALDRVFVLCGKREDIRHFLLGFFARVGAADSFPLIVNAKHLRNGFVVGHPKETFQHTNDEVHWSIVVIQQ